VALSHWGGGGDVQVVKDMFGEEVVSFVTLLVSFCHFSVPYEVLP